MQAEDYIYVSSTAAILHLTLDFIT